MSTYLADYRAALYNILTDFQAANPDLLRQVYRARPGTFHPPLAYVGNHSEPTITHEFGNRQNRNDMRSQLILVQGIYENAETLDKLDVLTDSLLAYLVSEHARAGGSKLIEPTGHEYVELAITGEKTTTNYAAVIVAMRMNAVA